MTNEVEKKGEEILKKIADDPENRNRYLEEFLNFLEGIKATLTDQNIKTQMTFLIMILRTSKDLITVLNVHTEHMEKLGESINEINERLEIIEEVLDIKEEGK